MIILALLLTIEGFARLVETWIRAERMGAAAVGPRPAGAGRRVPSEIKTPRSAADWQRCAATRYAAPEEDTDITRSLPERGTWGPRNWQWGTVPEACALSAVELVEIYLRGKGDAYVAALEAWMRDPCDSWDRVVLALEGETR